MGWYQGVAVVWYRCAVKVWFGRVVVRLGQSRAERRKLIYGQQSRGSRPRTEPRAEVFDLSRIITSCDARTAVPKGVMQSYRLEEIQ